MKTVGIIGLGLIGGSMGLDLKERGYAGRVVGVEAVPLNAEAALKMGLADEIAPTVEDCVKKSEVIVVAVPVGRAVTMVCEILDIFQQLGQFFAVESDAVNGESVLRDLIGGKTVFTI